MDKILSTLQSLNLTEKEVKIYIASLSIGQTTASILGKKSGLARSTAQYTCNSLVNKRLMNISPQGNSFLYSPEEPEKLITMVNKEFFQVETKMKNVQKIMSDLHSISNPNAKIPKVKYFTGVDGIKDLFLDILKDKNTVKGYIYLGEKTNIELLKFFEKEYIPSRIELGIKAYAISNDVDNWSDDLKNTQKVNRQLTTISRELYPIDSCIQIYGDKVSFCSLVDGDLTGIIVENNNIAKTHLSCFDAIFKLSDSL